MKKVFTKIGHFFKKIGRFFRDTNSERKKVVWTSKKTTIRETVLVIVAIVVFAAVIGALDLLFSEAIRVLGEWINVF